MKKLLSLLTLAVCLSTMATAQVSTLTKEKVLAMSIEELSDMSLEDLMYAVELLDVQSVDELFSLIMNKNVSSASKKAEDSFKTPLSTSVITREEMRTFGCSTVEEALRLLPGIIAREKTNGNYDIHLRGLDNIPDGNMLLYTENVNTLLMINSRPVYNYAQGATMWETLPVSIEDIARIEVVRGPSSALYGSNAVTGVVNIITETPNEDSKSVSGSIQNGSLSTFVGDIAFRKAFNEKLAVAISGNYQKRNRPTRDLFIIPDSTITDERDGHSYAEGGWVSMSDMQYLHTADGGDMSEHSAPISRMFTEPEVARRNIGVNGAISFVPNSNISMQLTGGYQQSEAMTTPVGTDYFSMNVRESKTAYADLTADIYGINVQLNMTDGVQDFMKGAPSFKIRNTLYTATAEYDWEVNDQLTIRPGVNYRHNITSDNDYKGYTGIDKFGDSIRISSFLEGAPELNSLAGSVRFDYSPIDPLRLIAAYRIEKLNLPDDIYHSWQLAATYSINNDHNLRFIYSRANRSAIIVNTSSNYVWNRNGISLPDEVGFLGNPDEPVMHADNYELGYRFRPLPNIQFDLEAFYNLSSDYGALMSENAMMIQSEQHMRNLIGNAYKALAQYNTGHISTQDLQQLLNDLPRKELQTKADVRYQRLPYDVKQMGLSLAMDWIISDKLIAKLHANVQSTKIDNYYRYDQKKDMRGQLAASSEIYGKAIKEIFGMMMNPNTQNLVPGLLNSAHYGDQSAYKEYLPGYQQAVSEGKADEYLKQFYTPEAIGVYYGLKYGVVFDRETQSYIIGNTDKQTVMDLENGSMELEQGHKHKNTPSFYGMVGLIYKPIENLSIAGHAYYYGKQTTTTSFGVEDIDSKFIMNMKVGYRPTEQFEVFFNAHNLFNDNRREFVYMDKNPGIYSFGINFGL